MRKKNTSSAQSLVSVLILSGSLSSCGFKHADVDYSPKKVAILDEEAESFTLVYKTEKKAMVKKCTEHYEPITSCPGRIKNTLDWGKHKDFGLFMDVANSEVQSNYKSFVEGLEFIYELKNNREVLKSDLLVLKEELKVLTEELELLEQQIEDRRHNVNNPVTGQLEIQNFYLNQYMRVERDFENCSPSDAPDCEILIEKLATLKTKIDNQEIIIDETRARYDEAIAEALEELKRKFEELKAKVENQNSKIEMLESEIAKITLELKNARKAARDARDFAKSKGKELYSEKAKVWDQIEKVGLEFTDNGLQFARDILNPFSHDINTRVIEINNTSVSASCKEDRITMWHPDTQYVTIERDENSADYVKIETVEGPDSCYNNARLNESPTEHTPVNGNARLARDLGYILLNLEDENEIKKSNVQILAIPPGTTPTRIATIAKPKNCESFPVVCKNVITHYKVPIN